MLKYFYSLLCCEENKKTIVKPSFKTGRLIETATSTPQNTATLIDFFEKMSLDESHYKPYYKKPYKRKTKPSF